MSLPKKVLANAPIASQPARWCVQNCVKKGDRILQLSFRAGFKCGAGFWRALRDVKDAKHSAWDPYD